MTKMGLTAIRQTSTGVPNAELRRDFVLPLAIIASLIILTLTTGVHISVRAFDRESVVREQALAKNGIEQRIEEVALMVVPQADWDDAVSNLDNKYDPAWAEANIGKYLWTTNGFDRAFVLDADDRPIFAGHEGGGAPLQDYDQFSGVAPGLIKAVREREAKRGPIKGGPSRNMISQPIQANTLSYVRGELVIVTATLVQPDFGTALPKGARSPIVLTSMVIDAPFLQLFSKRFLLDGVAIRLPSQTPTPGMAEIPAKDESGKTLAYLTWKPLNPGYAMLRQMLPPIVAACVLLLAIAFFQLKRIFTAATGLIEREAFVRDIAFQDTATGLPNRNAFEEHLEWELESIEPETSTVAVTYIRLPGLWRVADALGTAARDELIGVVASRLGKMCRSDSLLARLSQDEFAIMSVTAQPQEALGFARRIRSPLGEPIALGEQQLQVHFKLGTSVTQIAMSHDELIHEAQVAAFQTGQEAEAVPA